MNDTCIICNRSDLETIAELSHTVVMLFPRPLKLGHIAVAPVRHVESCSQLTCDEAAEIGEVCTRMVSCLERLLGAEKVYVLGIGDRDPHFHLHLIPRLAGEPKLGKYAVGSNSEWRKSIIATTQEEQIQFAARLRSALPDRSDGNA